MKLIPIIFITAFLFCTTNKTIKDNNHVINTEFQADNECINKTRKIAIDSLKTDILDYHLENHENGIHFIAYKIKNSLKLMVFKIDDSCNIVSVRVGIIDTSNKHIAPE